MIDNNNKNVKKNAKNCILIKDFLGDENDIELVKYNEILQAFNKN